jgi:hypothetical protein
MKIIIYAVSGDCHAGAMSEKSDVIQIEHEHYDIVKDFLRNQLELNLALTLDFEIKRYDLTSWQPFYDAFYKSCTAMRDCGIFKHKWHTRTQWELGYLDELLEGCYGDPDKFQHRHYDSNIGDKL